MSPSTPPTNNSMPDPGREVPEAGFMADLRVRVRIDFRLLLMWAGMIGIGAAGAAAVLR
jgi:hypothetical protein